MSGTPLIINVGELAKPATVLIEKISGAIGAIYQPTHIRRTARAEADAGVIAANAEIQITDLQRRAMERFFQEEAKKQENIEAITSKAIPLLEASSKPEEVEDDWIYKLLRQVPADIG